MNKNGKESCKTLGVEIGIPGASQKWHAALCDGDRPPGR